MVSVFDGQLTRTWYFSSHGRNHVISLYHDTITGVRSAAVDYLEIPGSSGYSSLLMESKGHRIFFTVADLPGYLEIKRSGWTGFVYSCVVNDKKIPESTESIQPNQDPIFKAKITETTLTPDENSEYPVTWYYVQTTRITDNATTAVHRRFRDFVELNSQVKQNLKGHHLREILPPLPEKPLKSFTDHRDPTFIQDRQAKLNIYLTALVAIPHVCDMVCVKAFLGMMEQVREYSISFRIPTLGLSLIPADKTRVEQEGVPVIVGSVQKSEGGIITPGDSISKINGVPIAGFNFNGVINRIKVLPRPVIIHFIQVIGGKPVPYSVSPQNSPVNAGTSSSNHSQLAVASTQGSGNNPLLTPPSNPPHQSYPSSNSKLASEEGAWRSYHSDNGASYSHPAATTTTPPPAEPAKFKTSSLSSQRRAELFGEEEEQFMSTSSGTLAPSSNSDLQRPVPIPLQDERNLKNDQTIPSSDPTSTSDHTPPPRAPSPPKIAVPIGWD